MNDPGSVTQCVVAIQQGNTEAAERLWNQYFHSLLPVARRALADSRRAAADEEDVALSTLDTFVRRAEAGNYDTFGDRDEVWRLLVVITRCKSRDLVRFESALKRGGDKIESGLLLDEVTGCEPTPAFAAELLDEMRWMLSLARREDDRLHLILLRKLEGYSHQEIASELGCSVRTIERKLRFFQGIWQRDTDRRLGRE